jgi:hypothetical protein
MKHARSILLLATLMFTAALLPSSCQRKPGFGYDFESERILDDIEWKCRTLYRISSEHATSGSKSLEISFHPAPEGESGHYPGVSFSRFDPDWSGHRAIVFDAHNPENADLRLTLRIDDREAPEYPDRFNRSFTLSPGENHIAIPLGELVSSGTKRTLDPRRIQRVMFFLANPKERHTLYLDRIRLE